MSKPTPDTPNAKTVETLFGDRKLYVVKYPSTMTVIEIVTLMDWAKTWNVLSMYHDNTVVACYVKPNYAHHFEKDNSKHIVKYELKNFGDEQYLIVEGTIYDI